VLPHVELLGVATITPFLTNAINCAYTTQNELSTLLIWFVSRLRLQQ